MNVGDKNVNYKVWAPHDGEVSRSGTAKMDFKRLLEGPYMI
jgi:hypothetical protein